MKSAAPDRPSESGFTVHNRVELIRGGKPYFDLLEQMIDGAKQTLHFQTYIFEGDQTGMRVADALMRASHRGVRVFLLLDGFASKGLPATLIHRLLASGVNFRWFGPILRNRYMYIGRRLHHKIIVADATRCLVGGLNISDRYNDFPNAPAWMDWALLAEGEVAVEAFALCEGRERARWIPWRKPKVKHIYAGPFPDGHCLVRLRVNDWVLGKREIQGTYLQMLHQAKSEVLLMTSYFMPGGSLRKAMRLAVQRGVTVRIILAGVSDIPLAKLSERYLYGWLLRNRIEVYEYNRSVLHGKVAVSDGKRVTVGSYNLNDLSAKASIELNLEVRDETVGLQLQQALVRILREDCIQITSEFEHRTLWMDRVRQKVAYNLFRILLFLFTFYFRRQKD